MPRVVHWRDSKEFKKTILEVLQTERPPQDVWQDFYNLEKNNGPHTFPVASTREQAAYLEFWNGRMMECLQEVRLIMVPIN